MSGIPSPSRELNQLSGRSYFCCSRGNCIFFFQFPFWYILKQYIFRLCTTIWIRRFGLRLSFYLSRKVRLTLSQFIFAFPYSIKITWIMLRKVISHKKMVVLSAKFTILISWSPICIPLIILSVLMKLASTSIAIMYNSMESRHPW